MGASDKKYHSSNRKIVLDKCPLMVYNEDVPREEQKGIDTMREVTYYVADDGKQFEDESECRVYEFKCGTEHGAWKLLDGANRVLHNTDPNSYDDAEFIFLPNTDAGDKLSEMWDNDIIMTLRPDFLDDWGIEPGLWAYDGEREEWFHVGNRIEELQDMANTAMKAINKN